MMICFNIVYTHTDIHTHTCTHTHIYIVNVTCGIPPKYIYIYVYVYVSFDLGATNLGDTFVELLMTYVGASIGRRTCNDNDGNRMNDV